MVVSSSNNNQTKILNSSIQQPGSITTTTLYIPSTSNQQTNKRTNNISGGTVQVSSHKVLVTQNGNKLYMVLKSFTNEQTSFQEPNWSRNNNNT